MGLKIGIVTNLVSPEKSLNYSSLSEELGFDSFWIPDHMVDLTPSIAYDPWSMIGAIVARTHHLVVGTNVSDTQRAHPAKIAQVFSTLSCLSGGRTVLGIGAGEAMNLMPYGLPFDNPGSRVARLEEAVKIIRKLWSSSRKRRITFRGRFYSLHEAWLDQKPESKPPIYVGALGSRATLEVAGRYGDGWLPWLNTPETYFEKARIVKDAARKAGRSSESIDYVAPLYGTFSENPRILRRLLGKMKRSLVIEGSALRRMGVATGMRASSSYQNVLANAEVNTNIREIQDAVPDEIAYRFLVHGPPSQWIERIEKFQEAGATHVTLSFLDSQDESARRFSRSVLRNYRPV